MPALNYQNQFVPLIIGTPDRKILPDTKPFTLRNLRKDYRDPKLGETLYMFTGQRTKQCNRFAVRVCRFAVTIRYSPTSIKIPTFNAIINPAQLERFAQLDGFANFTAFRKFHGRGKELRLIAWITRSELAALLEMAL